MENLDTTDRFKYHDNHVVSKNPTYHLVFLAACVDRCMCWGDVGFDGFGDSSSEWRLSGTS